LRVNRLVTLPIMRRQGGMASTGGGEWEMSPLYFAEEFS
jgi:hypothetical protein